MCCTFDPSCHFFNLDFDVKFFQNFLKKKHIKKKVPFKKTNRSHRKKTKMFNLEMGMQSLLGSIGSRVVSATKAAQAQEKDRQQRAPFDNANFIKSVADAVYCIQLDGEPIVLECDSKIMPNQFVHNMSPVNPLDPVGCRYVTERNRFVAHQTIMREALEKNFKRILIVEPGVKLVNLPKRPFVFKEQPPVLVLGACLDFERRFFPCLEDSRLQFGRAQETHAVVVSSEFMSRFTKLDFDMFRMSVDEVYNQQPDVLFAIPAPFERTQACFIERFQIKVNNMYRNYCSWPIGSAVMALMTIYFLIIFLINLYRLCR